MNLPSNSWFAPLSVALHLRVGREAAHLTFANPALAGEGSRWERPAATVGQLEEPVSALVELDRVDVDLSPVLVREDEVRCGAPGFDLEADGEQCLLQFGHIRCVQNDVEVSMLTRLLAEKSIDAPPPVEPNLNRRIVEYREDFDNRVSIHRSGHVPAAQRTCGSAADRKCKRGFGVMAE